MITAFAFIVLVGLFGAKNPKWFEVTKSRRGK